MESEKNETKQRLPYTSRKNFLLHQPIPEGHQQCKRCVRILPLDEFKSKTERLTKNCRRCRKQINDCVYAYDQINREEKKKTCDLCKKTYVNLRGHLKSEKHLFIQQIVNNLIERNNKELLED